VVILRAEGNRETRFTASGRRETRVIFSTQRGKMEPTLLPVVHLPHEPRNPGPEGRVTLFIGIHCPVGGSGRWGFDEV